MIIPKLTKQRFLEYLSLFTCLVIGLNFYFKIDSNQVRRWIIYAVGITYFCWSLYHHYKRGDLQFSIVIEYLLIILLGIVFVSGTLF